MRAPAVTSVRAAFEYWASMYDRQAERVQKLRVVPGPFPSHIDALRFRREAEEAERLGRLTVRYSRDRQHVEWLEAGPPAAIYEALGRLPPSRGPSATATALLALLPPDLPDGERLAWMQIGDAIGDRWPVERLARLIAEVRAARPSSAKLLAHLPGDALRALGIERRASDRVVLLTAGASDPEAVVLVENPDAFEAAVEATADLPVCWISTHGILAQRLDSLPSFARAVAAVRSGQPPALPTLLAHPRLYYWGDLDRAGLKIYDVVRTKLPQIRLSALYRPMVRLLEDGGGHPYCDLTGKTGQLTWTARDTTFSALLALCESSAVDQEWVTREEIRALALDPL